MNKDRAEIPDCVVDFLMWHHFGLFLWKINENLKNYKKLSIHQKYLSFSTCIHKFFQIDKMYQEGEAVIVTMGQYFYINITSKRN